jgi:hypothetical protein
MSSSSPRETIQISLGPTANAITAHLLNLQGLAVTSSSSHDNVYCDPNTTHYVQRASGMLVPRVLMVDESTHHVPATLGTATLGTGSAGTTQDASNSIELSTNIFSSPFHNDSSFWNGQIQALGDESISAKAIGAWNNGYDNPITASRSASPFWNTASSMAYSSYSRYHRAETNDHTNHKYQSDPRNSRHVVWDDEEEEEAEEDPYERAYREQQDERRWKTQTSVAHGQELHRMFAQELEQTLEGKTDHDDSPPSPSKELSFDNWNDIWMPPRNEKSKVVLPYSSQSQLVPHWNVAYQGDLPFLQEWKEDALFEKFRHMLESCDYGIQGVSIATEGHGIYASLAGYLLEELKQECKSAARLIYHVTDEDGVSDTENTSTATNPSSDDGVAFFAPSSNSWQEAQVNRIRKQLSRGLALYDFTEKAHAVLPLQLPREDSSSLSWFRATAKIAMALEASTLPFRFHGRNLTAEAGRSSSYQIGLQNAPFLAQGSSDSAWGTTATRLTVSEFLQVLQPSQSYSILELDILSQTMDRENPASNQGLYNLIQQGTSVERDQRTRESRGHSYRTRAREVLPGTWMQDIRHLSQERRGLLSSLSYGNGRETSGMNLDRCVHQHFALSTSVRPVLSLPSDDMSGMTISNYLTCLVQGMGIQYRPERSMATILNQSIGQLTFGEEGGGNNYAAGIYWKYLIPQVDTPVVAVLGNTTRAYGSLNTVATEMKEGMKTTRFRGYFNRDVVNGVLPEMEDCEEALEACWNKRDVYLPSSGFGMDEDY